MRVTHNGVNINSFSLLCYFIRDLLKCLLDSQNCDGIKVIDMISRVLYALSQSLN